MLMSNLHRGIATGGRQAIGRRGTIQEALVLAEGREEGREEVIVWSEQPKDKLAKSVGQASAVDVQGFQDLQDRSHG